MDEYSVLIVIALLFLVGPPVLSIVAISRGNGTKRLVAQAQASLDQALVQIATLRSEIRVLRENAAGTVAEAPAQPEPAPPAEDRVEAPPEPPAPPEPATAEPPPSAAIRSAAEQPAAPLTETPDKPAVEKQSFEEVLASRWLVWLGAVVVALGSIFLVKFAIDQGLLGPAVRNSLTFLLGTALVVGGEWLRRRPLQRAIAAIRPNYVPLALTASGLFAAFASIYAAHVFHGLLGPLPALAGLAVVAFVAVALSLLQGKFVALLGLLGASATPLLIATPDPSLWALLTYLLVIQAACLSLVRYQGWQSLGFGTLAMAVAWPFLIWSRHNGLSDAEVIPLGIYLLSSVGGFFVLRHLLQGSTVSLGAQNWTQKLEKRPIDVLAWAAALLVAVLVLLVVRAADFSSVSLTLLAAFSAFYLIVGRFTEVLEGLGVVAAMVTLAAIMSWPQLYFAPEEIAVIEVFTLFGALFGIAGFVALWGAERPALWAGVSISVPLLLLIIAYWLVADFVVDIWWVVLAIGLGAIALAAATRVVVYRDAYGLNISLGFYAAGVVAFVTLAATMLLEQAWLTVAMSVQLVALGWIYRHIPERSLEKIALAIAGIVLIRLVVNPNILDYALGDPTSFTWILYGYGVPALTFFGAAKLFRDSKLEPLVTVLQAGSLVFAILLVSFHIRLFVAGSLDSFDYGLLEQSLHSITWLSIGTALAIRHQRRPHQIALYGSRVLLWVAAAQIVILQLLFSNPLQSMVLIGDHPIFNTLFLAYAVPAGFAFFLARRFQHEAPPWQALAWVILAFVLVFAYLSFEVTRAYHGPVLYRFDLSDAESYTYSLVWLVYALALLAIGIASKSTLPRYVSLAVLFIILIKAFLFDMADLSGLLRVSTFLILGLTLIGIGYLYQRYVFRLPASEPAEEEAVTEEG